MLLDHRGRELKEIHEALKSNRCSKVYATDVVEQTHLDRTTTKKLLNELVEQGYLERHAKLRYSCRYSFTDKPMTELFSIN